MPQDNRPHTANGLNHSISSPPLQSLHLAQQTSPSTVPSRSPSTAVSSSTDQPMPSSAVPAPATFAVESSSTARQTDNRAVQSLYPLTVASSSTDETTRPSDVPVPTAFAASSIADQTTGPSPAPTPDPCPAASSNTNNPPPSSASFAMPGRSVPPAEQTSPTINPIQMRSLPAHLHPAPNQSCKRYLERVDRLNETLGRPAWEESGAERPEAMARYLRNWDVYWEAGGGAAGAMSDGECSGGRSPGESMEPLDSVPWDADHLKED